MLSSKGVAGEDVPLMLWKILLVGLSAAAITVLTAFAGVNDIKADVLDMQQMTLNMINSPHVFAIEDAITGRVYANSIDLEKFQEVDFSEAIRTERNDLAMHFHVLVDGEEYDRYYVSSGRSSAEEFSIYEVLIDQGRGTGRVFTTPVLVQTEEGMMSGILETSVIVSS